MMDAVTSVSLTRRVSWSLGRLELCDKGEMCVQWTQEKI